MAEVVEAPVLPEEQTSVDHVDSPTDGEDFEVVSEGAAVEATGEEDSTASAVVPAENGVTSPATTPSKPKAPITSEAKTSKTINTDIKGEVKSGLKTPLVKKVSIGFSLVTPSF